MQKINDLLTEHPELAEAVVAFVDLLCEKKGIESQFLTKIYPANQNRPGWIPVLGRTAAGIIHFWDQTFLPEPKQAITELDELVARHIGKSDHRFDQRQRFSRFEGQALVRKHQKPTG